MKRTLAFLLSLMMVLSMLPASVLATETPAQEQLELLDSTSSLDITQTSDGVLVTYTVPDMAAATDQLFLFRYDSESGSSKRVTHTECTDLDDWNGLTYTWFIDGSAFAEHGEGHYYCATADGTVESGKLEFAYAADAVQLDPPSNLTLNEDSLDITWESDDSVMAVIIRDNTGEILDYRRVFDGHTTIPEVMEDITEDGLYVIALFAFSGNDYVYHKPSDWASVVYKLGSNPETDPDYPQDNPDAVARYTRMQVADLLVSALEWEYDADQMGHITFSDVTDPIDAQTAAIVAYHQAMNGTAANTFDPDSYVTRAQLAQILFRALDLPAGTFIPNDAADASWCTDAMSAVVEANLMFTDAYGNFYPNNDATTDDVDPDRIRELANPSTESGTRGKCGDNLQWELDLSTYVLTITGSGEMYDYNDAPWSAWSEQITAVSLPEGLTHLGGSALYTCGQITELTLPSTLESIGNRAIASCWFLESLHIPAKVTDIGANAFGFNTFLTEITVDPANTVFRAQNGFLLTMDGKTLVAVPSGLTGTLTLPVGIATLGNHAFCGNRAEQIILPASLTTIENRAFFGCNYLESIEIPAGVTQIDEEAFYRCKDLHTVTFLGNAPTLGEDVFGGCASDFCIYYDPANTGWSTPQWNGWPACPTGTAPVLPEAPAASKLQWNVGITSSGEKTAAGWFSFYGTNGVDYAVNLYRKDAAGDSLILSKTATPVKGYYNVIPFNYDPDRCQTGDYYFTVQAMGDGNAYADGPIQTSAVWHYTRPNAELVPTDLYWSVDKSMNWNLDETYVLEYHVGVLYNGTEDDLNGARMVDEDWYGTTETPVLSEELLAKYGTGWYYFAVQPITYDPTVTLTPADIFYSNGYYYYNASATLPEAPAATDLQWNTWRNNSGSDSEYQLGAISFGRTDTGMEQNFRVDFYRQEASGDKKIGELWAYLREGRPYRTMYPFEELDDVFTTGTYYFTVTALGNGVTTSDSKPVRSGNWSYTRPDIELEVSSPKWNKDMSMQWTDGAQNDGYVEYYTVQYQFVPDGSEFVEGDWDYQTSYWPDSRDDVPAPPADLLNQYGNGRYFFRMRAISADITAAVSSEWTDWSSAFGYTKPDTTLTVSNLKWNGNTLSWTPSFGSDAPLAGYNIYLYDSADAASAQERNWDNRFWVPADETELVLDRDWLEDLMGQTWYFAVSTITAAPANASSNFGSAPVTEWTYQAPTTPAPAAYDLQWGVERWNENDYNTVPGAISFTCDVPDDVETVDFQVDIYRRDGQDSVHIGTTHLTVWPDEYSSFQPFEHFADKFTSGTYYFTVTSMGDGSTTCDGKPVTSGDWTYTRPNTQYGVSDPEWNSDMSMQWTAGSTGQADYYVLQFQHVGPGDTFHADSWNDRINYWPGEGMAYPTSWILNQGNGKVYFRVLAMPDDVTRVAPSQWSDWSVAFDYSMPSLTLTASNLRWDAETGEMLWDLNGSSDLVDYYQVRFYHSKSNSRPSSNFSSTRFDPEDAPFTLPDWVLRDRGEGYYWFAVRPYSNDPTKALSGEYVIGNNAYYFEGASTPAPAPFDLQWNTWRNDSGSDSRYQPGVISFGRLDTNTEQEFRVDFYRKEASGDKKIGELWTDLREGRPYRTMYPFEQLGDIFTTGTYYFTVTAMGDGATTCDGQPVYSNEWSYTRPDVKLGLSNAHWGTDMSINWTDAAHNDGYLDYYEVRYQYVGPGDTFREDDWNYGTSYHPGDSNDFPYPPADLMGDCGNGKYYFRIRAISNSIHDAVYSDWTDWSEAFTYTRPATTLTVSDLKWEGNTLSWTPDFGKDAPLAGYRIYVYEKSSYAVSDPNAWWDWDSVPADATSYTMPKWMLENLPDRTWYFAVTTISANPAAYNSNYGSAATAEWTYQAPTTPAAAAYDLQWGVRRWQIGQSYEEPGVISFGGTVPQNADWAEFRVDIYRREADGNVKIGTFYRDLRNGNDFTYYQPFYEFADQFLTGTYFFTVTALGDGVNTCDGQPVTSPDWSYTRPDVTLGVSNPVWNSNMSIGWTDAPQNVGLLSNFDLEFRYVAPGQTFDPNRGNAYGTGYTPNSGDDPYPHSDMLLDCGSGTYYFRMRAMSEDITQAVPSGWTEWSTGFAYTRPSTTLTVSNLKWEGNTLSWTPDFDPATAPLLKYWIYVYENAGDAISWPQNNQNRYLLKDASATSFTLENWMMDDLEGRDWHFAVVTVTSDPTKANSNWGSAPTCKWTYTPPANKLATPTNLRWHVDFEWEWDEVNDKQLFIPFTRYGSMAFDAGTPTQDHYDVELWQVKASGDVLIHDTSWSFGSTDERTSLSVPDFIYHVTESGTYYFKVRARSDDMNYADSDWATSSTWTYTAPTAQLKAPTGLYWDDYSIEHAGVKQIAQFWQTDPEAGYYEVEHFFSPTENGTPKGGNSSFDMHNGEGVHNTLHDGIIEDWGEGWYYFRVRAISPDITKIRNSAWSAMSPVYNLSLVVDNANQKLDDILGDTSDDNYTAPTATQIQQAVEEIEHLDKAMAADAADGSTGTLEKLAELEQLVMDELKIVPETNVDADVFTPALADKITVSNMALNVDIDKVDKEEETAVTLTISGAGVDKPDTPEELNPAQYSNTLMFKMDIPEAKDNDPAPGKQLKIPVQITLPIPADINPNFLVVLHHKSDGTWEELRLPHIFKDGGQWYATFNVHEFSYYALSQVAPTAQAEGNTVIVDAHLPTNGVKTQYLCGVYSEQGQMLGMGILQPQAETALTITLDAPVPSGAYVKIFAPDAGAGWTVHSQAIEVEIK